MRSMLILQGGEEPKPWEGPHTYTSKVAPTFFVAAAGLAHTTRRGPRDSHSQLPNHDEKSTLGGSLIPSLDK